MKKFVLFFLLFFNFIFAQTKLNQDQINNLAKCFEISSILKNNPYDVCAIMLNETSAKTHYVGDKFLKKFHRSYGIMQVRLSTAKFLINYYNLKEFKNFSDEIILSKLIFDKNFNILMANLFFKYLYNKYNHNLEKTVIAYNSGYYDPKNISYYKRFLENKLFLLKNFPNFNIKIN